MDEPALQPDSAKFEDVSATPYSQEKTDSESHDGAQDSEHRQAAVQQTDTKDAETAAQTNSHLSVVEDSLASQTDHQGLARQSLPIIPTSVSETQTLDPVATPRKDPLETSSTSQVPCQAGDFTQRTNHEVVDLTQDGPYNGPRIDITKETVKQEPHDVMSNTAPVTTPTPEPPEVDAMDFDAQPSNNYDLPELDGEDAVWQSTPEDKAEETEDTLAILKTAGENFWASLPMKNHPPPTGHNMDIDSEAEDAEAIRMFEQIKKDFLRKKKTGKLDLADEVEYKRAQQAESARKRRRARDHARRASPELEDQSMFLSDDDQQSTSPKPARLLLAGKSSKGRGRPSGSKTVVKGGIHKTTKQRLRPSTMNFGSLFHNDIITIAQENQRKESQPVFTSKNKAKALSELISSMPKEQQKLHAVDMRELNIATKKFAGRGSMKADGAGGWKLKGMRSSLHHYQLLGAAFMRDLEQRNTKPFGGFVSDDMGLGKTVMAICNIIDGRPTPQNRAKATLVVAPSSLLTQWMTEIMKHAEPGILGRVLLYRSGSRLIVNDIDTELRTEGVVITSYHEVLRSFPKNDPPPQLCTDEAKSEWWANERKHNLGPLHRIEWRRVIIDEAQAIKNYQSRTSQAVCHLKSKYRWAISGTPIQNRLEEFYAFFRFLDLPHTGSYETFRLNFCKRDSELAIKRLRHYLDQFMLRFE